MNKIILLLRLFVDLKDLLLILVKWYLCQDNSQLWENESKITQINELYQNNFKKDIRK